MHVMARFLVTEKSDFSSLSRSLNYEHMLCSIYTFKSRRQIWSETLMTVSVSRGCCRWVGIETHKDELSFKETRSVTHTHSQSFSCWILSRRRSHLCDPINECCRSRYMSKYEMSGPSMPQVCVGLMKVAALSFLSDDFRFSISLT